MILDCFEVEEAIKFQALNRSMYYAKTPQMFSVVFGRKIEPCILVYTNYNDTKGAVSCIIADGIDKANPETMQISKKVDDFLMCHPYFAAKYDWTCSAWPCCEDKTKLVAVFKFKHARKVRLENYLKFNYFDVP